MTGPHCRITVVYELVDCDVALDQAGLEDFKRHVLVFMAPAILGQAGAVVREHLNVLEQLVELQLEVPIPR